MTAIYITVWVLSMGSTAIPNIAGELACHKLAKDLKASSYTCAPYPGVVGTTDRAVCVPRNTP